MTTTDLLKTLLCMACDNTGWRIAFKVRDERRFYWFGDLDEPLDTLKLKHVTRKSLELG